jgi:hypothetical protein
MAAGCTSVVSRRRSGIALVAVIGLTLAACGQSMQTPLPDLSAKAEPPPGGRTPLSRAEQKQAIDGLIAKRDAMEQPQPK